MFSSFTEKYHPNHHFITSEIKYKDKTLKTLVVFMDSLRNKCYIHNVLGTLPFPHAKGVDQNLFYYTRIYQMEFDKTRWSCSWNSHKLYTKPCHGHFFVSIKLRLVLFPVRSLSNLQK